VSVVTAAPGALLIQFRRVFFEEFASNIIEPGFDFRSMATFFAA